MSLWMLFATPGYCRENQQPRECVCVVSYKQADGRGRGRVPGSWWQVLGRLSTHRDAPDRWKRQRKASRQKTTVCPSSRALNPPPGLSAGSDTQPWSRLLRTNRDGGPVARFSSGGPEEHADLHLPARHEICTLTDPLEDLLQLGVNERVI